MATSSLSRISADKKLLHESFTVTRQRVQGHTWGKTPERFLGPTRTLNRIQEEDFGLTSCIPSTATCLPYEFPFRFRQLSQTVLHSYYTNAVEMFPYLTEISVGALRAELLDLFECIREFVSTYMAADDTTQLRQLMSSTDFFVFKLFLAIQDFEHLYDVASHHLVHGRGTKRDNVKIFYHIRKTVTSLTHSMKELVFFGYMSLEGDKVASLRVLEDSVQPSTLQYWKWQFGRRCRLPWDQFFAALKKQWGQLAAEKWADADRDVDSFFTRLGLRGEATDLRAKRNHRFECLLRDQLDASGDGEVTIWDIDQFVVSTGGTFGLVELLVRMLGLACIVPQFVAYPPDIPVGVASKNVADIYECMGRSGTMLYGYCALLTGCVVLLVLPNNRLAWSEYDCGHYEALQRSMLAPEDAQQHVTFMESHATWNRLLTPQPDAISHQ